MHGIAELPPRRPKKYPPSSHPKATAPGGVMSEIDSFTSTIAAAVSEQDAAAIEISRSIGQAAAGTESVARSIAGTATATENTNRSADLVLATARNLSDQAVNLRSSVDRFLSNVAA